MATIAFQITETGFANLSKTYTLADAQLDRVVVALQGPANIAVNGTATRAQVLNYWTSTAIDALKAAVKAYETQAAIDALPPVTPITPT